MEKLLTVKDIQRIFSCSKTHAYSLMHSEGFPSVSINSRVYVEGAELEKWLETYKCKTYRF